MKKESKNKRDWIFWMPRIIAIIFILFLALFSFDVFDSCYSFLNCTLGLFMHNLPSIILTLILCISWPEKRGWLAGSGFILAGFLYLFFVIKSVLITGFEWYYLAWIAQIALPAFFVGILFFIGWRRKSSRKF